jgi:hypothetical protein
MALGQPAALRGERLAQLHELLVRRQEALAHDRRCGGEEVDCPQQLVVQRGLRLGQLARVRRGESDDVRGPQLLEQRPKERAPQRHQVVALVEDDDAHTRVDQRAQPGTRGRREQLGRRQVGQLARGRVALQASDQASDVALAPLGRGTRPLFPLALDLVS